MLLGAAAAGALCLASAQFFMWAPVSWTHRLNDACRWQSREWALSLRPLILVGLEISPILAPPKLRLTPSEREAMQRCYLRRGGFGYPVRLHTILSKWPTR